MREILFIIFGVFTIASAATVILSRNSVYSAFGLILSFFGLSVLYVLWGSTFLAMIQILIYTGAIVVLFVFVVMLLNLSGSSTTPSHGWLTLLVSAGAAWAFCLLLLRTLNEAPFSVGTGANSTMRGLSKLLFNEYLWPFEVLSLFLLALIVAIFALARPDEKEGD